MSQSGSSNGCRDHQIGYWPSVSLQLSVKFNNINVVCSSIKISTEMKVVYLISNSTSRYLGHAVSGSATTKHDVAMRGIKGFPGLCTVSWLPYSLCLQHTVIRLVPRPFPTPVLSCCSMQIWREKIFPLDTAPRVSTPCLPDITKSLRPSFPFCVEPSLAS